jgi:hypothetical protein
MAVNRSALVIGFVLALSTSLSWRGTAIHAQAQVLPGIGDSLVVSEIRVTLLDARPLSLDDYRRASGELLPEWAGGGFRFAFLVENRPGAEGSAALGEIRVFVDSRPYNAVTNPTSRKAFAPDVVIRTVSDFFSTSYGRTVKQHGPPVRDSAASDVLDVFVRGGAIPKGADIVVELEQGETHRPDATGRLRALTPAEMGASWTNFRFALSPASR